MWIVRICDEGKQVLPGLEDFWIKGNGPVRIGRHLSNECPIAFVNDKSVSRDHAEILVDNGVLYVMDKGSKFGTHIYEEDQVMKLLPNERVEINEGQLILFGATQSFVVVHKLRLQVCSTQLNKDKKKMVGDAIKRLGGISVEDVEFATHIVTSAPIGTMTPKLLAAVIHVREKKLITPDWFAFALVETENRAVPIPREELFFPEIDTSKVQLENKDMPRHGLLRGKTVLLARKSDEVYACALQGCGANIVRGYGDDPVSRETKVDCTLYGGESKPNDESSQYITGDQLPPMGGCLAMYVLVEAVLSNKPPNITAEFPRIQRDGPAPSQSQGLHTQGTVTIAGKQSKALSASSSKSSHATSTMHPPPLRPVHDNIDISSQSAPPSRQQEAVPAPSSSSAALSVEAVAAVALSSSSSSSSSSSHAAAGAKAAVKGRSPPSATGHGKSASTAPVVKAVKTGYTDRVDVDAEGEDEDEEGWHDSCAPSPPARAPRGDGPPLSAESIASSIGKGKGKKQDANGGSSSSKLLTTVEEDQSSSSPGSRSTRLDRKRGRDNDAADNEPTDEPLPKTKKSSSSSSASATASMNGPEEEDMDHYEPPPPPPPTSSADDDDGDDWIVAVTEQERPKILDQKLQRYKDKYAQQNGHELSTSQDLRMYNTAIVVDMPIVKPKPRPNLSKSSSSSSSSSLPSRSALIGGRPRNPRDVRCFRKNFVKLLSADEKIRSTDMELVLPKESERSRQLVFEYQEDDEKDVRGDELFADRFAGGSKKRR